MSFALIPLSRCAELCGLESHEMIPGAARSPFHQSLYESYLMLCDRGADFVRDLIVGDLRRALDLGATRLAAELLLVLRRFLSTPRGAPPLAQRVARPIRRPCAGRAECDRSATAARHVSNMLRLGLRRIAFRASLSAPWTSCLVSVAPVPAPLFSARGVSC